MKSKIFTALFFIISLSVGISVFFNFEGTSSQKQNLTQFPQFTQEGKLNFSFTNELSNYVTENVAFHDKIVSINAYLGNKLFKTSTQPQVVIGNNDTLYFEETVNDYLGAYGLSDREIFNICDTLSQIQRYCDRNSIKFAFTVAPNKNTLYSGNMPKRYIKAGQSNLERLSPELQNSGVNYVDLCKVFSALDESNYYKTDTHWNQKGAIAGYEAIMQSLFESYTSFKDTPLTVQSEHRGDLGEMLYPGFNYTESEKTVDYNFNYKTLGKFKSADDIIIRTKNESGNNSLLMFRDSFGIALFPFIAENFKSTYYTRQVPVDLTLADTQNCDTVIYEIVERNLKNILLFSPVFKAETVLPSKTLDCKYELETEENGELLHVFGTVNDELMTAQKIFVCVLDEDGNSVYYNTTGTFSGGEKEKYSDSCFSSYVERSALPQNYTIKIVIGG